MSLKKQLQTHKADNTRDERSDWHVGLLVEIRIIFVIQLKFFLFFVKLQRNHKICIERKICSRVNVQQMTIKLKFQMTSSNSMCYLYAGHCSTLAYITVVGLNPQKCCSVLRWMLKSCHSVVPSSQQLFSALSKSVYNWPCQTWTQQKYTWLMWYWRCHLLSAN